jgi:hypothetical protein
MQIIVKPTMVMKLEAELLQPSLSDIKTMDDTVSNTNSMEKQYQDTQSKHSWDIMEGTDIKPWESHHPTENF